MAIVRRRRCGRSRVSVPIMRVRPAEQMTGGFAASDAGVGRIQQIGNMPAEFPVVEPWKDRKDARVRNLELPNPAVGERDLQRRRRSLPQLSRRHGAAWASSDHATRLRGRTTLVTDACKLLVRNRQVDLPPFELRCLRGYRLRSAARDRHSNLGGKRSRSHHPSAGRPSVPPELTHVLNLYSRDLPRTQQRRSVDPHYRHHALPGAPGSAERFRG